MVVMNGTSIAPSQIILLGFLFKLWIARRRSKSRDDENLKLGTTQWGQIIVKMH